jgi:hypothetical protein
MPHFPSLSKPNTTFVQHIQPASTYEEFMAAVRQIASVFPGGCTVHVDPPGYTLAEHVKHLSEQQRERERRLWQSRRTVRSS